MRRRGIAAIGQSHREIVLRSWTLNFMILRRRKGFLQSKADLLFHSVILLRHFLICFSTHVSPLR